MCAGWRAAGSQRLMVVPLRPGEGPAVPAATFRRLSKAALSACASSIGCCLLITVFSPCTVILIIPDPADSSR